MHSDFRGMNIHCSLYIIKHTESDIGWRNIWRHADSLLYYNVEHVNSE